MLYFDILEPIKVLSDAEKGRLFVAILEYGQNGTAPVFDGMLALAWGFVKPKIDKDSEEYNRTILKRQYATFCRDRKRKGEPEITFDEWLMSLGDENHQVISSDTKWYPTTTTSTTTSTSTTTAAAATTTEQHGIAAATAERSLKIMSGELGKGVVALTDAQIEDLLEQLGLDMFDFYVDKLSNFIIKNKARVKNHYETILRWYQEDSVTDGGQ